MESDIAKAVTLEAMKIFWRNFLGLLRTPSAVNIEIKSLSFFEKLHFVQWDFFEPPGIIANISRN